MFNRRSNWKGQILVFIFFNDVDIGTVAALEVMMGRLMDRENPSRKVGLGTDHVNASSGLEYLHIGRSIRGEWKLFKSNLRGLFWNSFATPLLPLPSTYILTNSCLVFCCPNFFFFPSDYTDYDALTLAPSADSTDLAFDTTIFDTKDDTILYAALQLVSQLRDQHYYTDTASFTLRCTICNTALVRFSVFPSSFFFAFFFAKLLFVMRDLMVCQ